MRVLLLDPGSGMDKNPQHCSKVSTRMKNHTEKYRSKMGWNKQGQNICYNQSQKLTVLIPDAFFCIYSTILHIQ